MTKISSVKDYWKGKNIPQQWYSKKEPFTLQWFNEISYKRYERYYHYLKQKMEFEYHSGEDVLEIGCGLGTDLVQYAKNGSNVTGLDLNQDQINFTKLNFDLRGLEYKELKIGSAEELPFDDKKFDLVVSFGVLHHTPNTEKAIEEVYRVLKDDGSAIIMLYARGWKHYIKRCFIHGILYMKFLRYGFSWQKVYNELSEVHGNSPKTGVYTKRQVKKMFKSFPVVEVEKKRLGEFFEYKPYNTYKFPKAIDNLFKFFNLEFLLGENWLIRVQKKPFPKEESLLKVIFKHY